jgi:AraC-like DNA-binding protein
MFGGLYVSGALGGLLREFLDSEDLPALASRSRLEGWPADGRIALAEWISLLDMIAGDYPRPALGLAIGQRIRPRHIGVLGYLSLSCDTLGEAMLRFSRYNRLVYDGNPIAIDMSGSEVTISWGIEHGRPGQLADETAIAIFAAMTRLLVGQDLHPLAVNFVNPAPADLNPYSDFFQCPVSFGNTVTSVRFSTDFLRLPIRNSDAGLKVLLEQQAEAQLKALPETDHFEEQLNQALIRALHDGTPTLEQVASRLSMSARTLQRRLGERELNYQALLDRTRAELARRYLADPNLSLAEIAMLLAFSEQSAFNRAFKRWYGESPRRFRRAAG